MAKASSTLSFLTNLQQKKSYDILLPLSSQGFVPAKIIDTDNVLLSDGKESKWMRASEAKAILERRRQQDKSKDFIVPDNMTEMEGQCEEMMETRRKSKPLDGVSELIPRENGIVEIREEYVGSDGKEKVSSIQPSDKRTNMSPPNFASALSRLSALVEEEEEEEEEEAGKESFKMSGKDKKLKEVAESKPKVEKKTFKLKAGFLNKKVKLSLGKRAKKKKTKQNLDEKRKSMPKRIKTELIPREDGIVEIREEYVGSDGKEKVSSIQPSDKRTNMSPPDFSGLLSRLSDIVEEEEEVEPGEESFKMSGEDKKSKGVAESKPKVEKKTFKLKAGFLNKKVKLSSGKRAKKKKTKQNLHGKSKSQTPKEKKIPERLQALQKLLKLGAEKEENIKSPVTFSGIHDALFSEDSATRTAAREAYARSLNKSL
eukprot:g1631.t1